MGSDCVTQWQSSGSQQPKAPASCLKSYPAPKQTESDPCKMHIAMGIHLIMEIHCCAVPSSANEYTSAVATFRQPRERAAKGTISLLPPSAEMSQREPGVTPGCCVSIHDIVLCFPNCAGKHFSSVKTGSPFGLLSCLQTLLGSAVSPGPRRGTVSQSGWASQERFLIVLCREEPSEAATALQAPWFIHSMTRGTWA